LWPIQQACGRLRIVCGWLLRSRAINNIIDEHVATVGTDDMDVLLSSGGFEDNGVFLQKMITVTGLAVMYDADNG